MVNTTRRTARHRTGSQRVLLASISGALVLAGCSSSSTSHHAATSAATASVAATKAPYNVALIADLTGGDAPVGSSYAEGIQAYFAALNKRGGVNGHQVKLSGPFDGQTTPTGTQTAIRQALASKPSEIVGLVDYLGSAANLLKAAKTPTIALQVPDASWQIGSKLYPWYYQPVGDFVVPIINALKAQLGGSLKGKRIDVISYSLAPEVTLSNAIKKGIEATGGTIGTSKTVDLTQLSLTSEAAAIANDHPAAVVSNLVANGPKALMQGLAQNGFSGPTVAWQPGADEATISAIADPHYYAERSSVLPGANGVMNQAARAAGLPVTPQTDLSQGWINAAIAATGLAGCADTCSSTAIENAIDTRPVNTPDVSFGPVQYSASDHVGNWSIGLYHYDATSRKVVPVGNPTTAQGNESASYYGV